MRRGEFYRVHKPTGDTKTQRVYVIVSRQLLIDSKFSRVICAPVYSNGQGLSTQVAVGVEEGLKYPSWIMCDALISISKTALRDFIGSLSRSRMRELDRALKMALELV